MSGEEGIGIFDSTIHNVEKSIERAAKIQEVIAHNIANANTSGYVPEKFDEVLNKAVKRTDKSSVNLEEEVADLAKNSARFSAYVKIMTAKLGMLRSVVTQGRK